MAIKTLFVECLRNINSAKIELSPAFNFFYGQNGAGKTSVLEAVDLISNGRTFRTRYTKPLIKNEKDKLTVGAYLFSSTHIKIEKTHKETRAIKDGKPATKQSQISEILPVWSIHPNSHNIIQGSRSTRRKFMDKGVFHVKHEFYPAWKTYQKALEQRNYLLAHPKTTSKNLKEQAKSWENAMVSSAGQLDDYRRCYIQELTTYIDKTIAERNDMPIRVAYKRGWGEDMSFSECLENNWDKDVERGYTQMGPHRAGLNLFWGKYPADEHASRGQQKIVAIVLVAAQIKMFCDQRAKKGILLADDIYTELDDKYLYWITKQLNDLDAQILITKTNGNHPLPPKEKEVRMFHVKHGRVYISQ